MSQNLIALTLDIAKEAVNQKTPGATNLTSADAGFGKLMSGLMSFIMTIGTILVLVYLLWGSIEWITSGGDKGKVETARTKITNAVIGLIVLGASTAILVLVQNFLGMCFIKIGGSCSTK